MALAVQVGTWEVAHIAAQAASFQRFQHGAVGHHAFAAEVQQHGSRPHQADIAFVDQVAGGLEQGHVQGHEVRMLEHLVHAAGTPHLRGQAPGGVDRDLGVEAQHLHAQADGGFGHQAADLAQADDAQGLALQFVACKLLLAVFDCPFQVGRGHVQPGHELQRRRQVARGQQHAGQHQFLHRVGIRARCVEHRHAARAHRLDRDVVGARTGAADGAHAVGDRHAVQVGAAHQHRHGVGHVLAHAVQIGGQARQAAGRDLIEHQHRQALSHAGPRIPSCRPPGLARLQWAWRCRWRRAYRPPSGGP